MLHEIFDICSAFSFLMVCQDLRGLAVLVFKNLAESASYPHVHLPLLSKIHLCAISKSLCSKLHSVHVLEQTRYVVNPKSDERAKVCRLGIQNPDPVTIPKIC